MPLPRGLPSSLAQLIHTVNSFIMSSFSVCFCSTLWSKNSNGLKMAWLRILHRLRFRNGLLLLAPQPPGNAPIAVRHLLATGQHDLLVIAVVRWAAVGASLGKPLTAPNFLLKAGTYPRRQRLV